MITVDAFFVNVIIIVRYEAEALLATTLLRCYPACRDDDDICTRTRARATTLLQSLCVRVRVRVLLRTGLSRDIRYVRAL
eukprot:scaffold74763_cov19-Prasinocladus_malaysianus.AAC.1